MVELLILIKLMLLLIRFKEKMTGETGNDGTKSA